MPKFRLTWTQLVEEKWQIDIEAETEEEVKEMWYENTYEDGTSTLIESTVKDTYFGSITELPDQQ